MAHHAARGWAAFWRDFDQRTGAQGYADEALLRVGRGPSDLLAGLEQMRRAQVGRHEFVDRHINDGSLIEALRKH